MEGQVADKIRNFTDLIVWQKSHQLTLAIYKLTKTFPQEERYGITSQMRRAVVSISANIAEGFEKRTNKDKVNFYNIAQGSLAELKYFLLVTRDFGHLNSARSERAFF
jgi:four helix bundle protein